MKRQSVAIFVVLAPVFTLLLLGTYAVAGTTGLIGVIGLTVGVSIAVQLVLYQRIGTFLDKELHRIKRELRWQARARFRIAHSGEYKPTLRGLDEALRWRRVSCRLSENAVFAKAVTFWGDEMNVVLPEVVSQNLSNYGYFEEGLSIFLLTYLKEGATFFDIGAHFGYFSSLAARLVGNNGQVHSFEPTRSTFDVLMLNTSAFANTRINNLALWSSSKLLPFCDFGVEYSAFNSLFDPRLDQEIKAKLTPVSYDVQTISVDEYVAQTGAVPTFVKIDAESAEFEILKGMESVLRQYRPMVCIEVGDQDIEGVVPSRQLITHMVERNYTPYEYREGEVIIHSLRERYKYENILFLPT